MGKNRQVIIYVLIIISILASLYFDSQLIVGASFLRNAVLDNFFMIITLASSEILIFFVLTALFLWREHKRRWILPLWITLGFSALISFILKVAIQRPRPFQTGIVSLIPSLQEASFSIWNFSFPSFQSMLAFCAIPILSEQFPKLKKFWIAFAVLVGFSRIYFGVHFFSDVITGGLIGYVIGMIIVKIEKETKFGKKIYEKIFRK
jgi:undecaprenyl-diphosphatase